MRKRAYEDMSNPAYIDACQLRDILHTLGLDSKDSLITIRLGQMRTWDDLLCEFRDIPILPPCQAMRVTLMIVMILAGDYELLPQSAMQKFFESLRGVKFSFSD